MPYLCLRVELKLILLDLMLDNIMLTFENQSTIEAYVDKQGAYPMARKVYDDHVIYQCHNDFGPVWKGLGKMIPKITDFGLAYHCNVPVLFYPIQRDRYRAPEVFLGLGWSFSADIWNFGLVVSLHMLLIMLFPNMGTDLGARNWEVPLFDT